MPEVNDAHYAVVVGINRYPGIGDLGGARRDAEQFAAWLLDPEGGALPPENVKRVWVTEDDEAGYATPQGARPTHDEIDYALEAARDDFQPKLDADPTVWDRSRIYLYVAGHGFAPQGGEGALLLANATSGALSRNVELFQYRRWCTTCAFFREVIVFADCCRTRVRSAAPGFGPRLDECPAPWMGKSSTWLIGYGSTLGKPTYELPTPGADDEARGYFTRALLDGLRGGAARDDSGVITAAKLSGFVKTVVAEQTSAQPFPQEAQIHGEFTEEIRFGAPAAPPKRAVTIVLPAAAQAARVVKDGSELAVWDGADRDWRVELADGLYEVEAGGVALANDGLFKVAGKDRRVEL
jgi:hypothetical protein